ncbi:MAG: hypothetical protein SO142_02840, partial [Prevotella sp.]|nr:hypothetical protein [Prevotella sp.]
TATYNVALAANFTGDYIFLTEGDAQLDITVPGFSGYSSTALPKYGLVAGGSASKIIVNQSGTNTLALPNTLLATENDGTIDCYANISTKGIYNAAGGTMNIYSESGEVETFTDDGGTVNITGPVKFYSTFTSLGTATLLSENVTSLAKLVLGKQSSMTFTSKWVKPNSLNISFKDNDYVLDQTYITFESSTTMLSGFETVSFTLQSEHSAYLDNNTHQLSIEEVDSEAIRHLDATNAEVACKLKICQSDSKEIEDRLESYYKQGLLTEIEYRNYILRIAAINDDISVANQYLSTYEGLHPVFYGKKSVEVCERYAIELEDKICMISAEIDDLLCNLENLAASRKKPFTNTDDLQDYLNSLAGNNATTPSDPAKVSVEKGTNIEDLTIPKDTHVEIDIDGNGGGTDDLQAYLNGLVNVSGGGSLTIKGKWVVLSGALNPRIEVRGIIDIYATIVIEGTREEVIHVYSGGTANWRGEMQGGKIVNEGELNHYSGSTDYIENRGTAKHTGGTCHHVVNYKTYTFSGGTIDGSASPYTCSFENHGTAHLTGGTIIHHTTLIYIVKGATTYIDGAHLDDSNATTTVLAYDDFHIRGDYAPKSIVIDNGVCIHFLTAWTVRWHITFIDNRTTIRKVIFHSENFNVTEDYIKYIDFILPDGYRWYYNPADNGLEIRDKKVYDTDDLQHFLDLLKTNPGTASDPVVLDGDNHTVPLPLDNAGGFRFPDNTYIVVRDIIFRYVSPTAKRRWTVPSGSTVVLRNVTIDGGDGASNYEDAEIFVDGGSLHIDNVVFVNVHLNITRTIYIRSAVTSSIYIRYTKDGALSAGDRIAEGAEGYYLTDSDVRWFTHIDYDGVQNLWQFRRNGNVIELYLSDPSGIAAVEAAAEPRACISPDGTLRLSGISAAEPCAVFRTDGTLLVKGTASELTARPVILAPGAYILRTRNASLKFVR